MAGGRLTFKHSNLRNYMKVSGQAHATAAVALPIYWMETGVGQGAMALMETEFSSFASQSVEVHIDTSH